MKGIITISGALISGILAGSLFAAAVVGQPWAAAQVGGGPSILVPQAPGVPGVVATGPGGPAVALPAPALSKPAAAEQAAQRQPAREGLAPLAAPRIAAPLPVHEPQLVAYEVETTEVTALMDDGISYTYWTFGDTVPGRCCASARVIRWS